MEIYPIDLSIYAIIASYLDLVNLSRFTVGLPEIATNRFWQYLLLERYPNSSKITGYINYQEYYQMILWFDEGYNNNINVISYSGGSMGRQIRFMYISKPIDNKKLFMDTNYSENFDLDILINLIEYKLLKMGYQAVKDIIMHPFSNSPTLRTLVYYLKENYLTESMLLTDLNKGFLNVNDLKFRKKLEEIKNFIPPD